MKLPQQDLMVLIFKSTLFSRDFQLFTQIKTYDQLYDFLVDNLFKQEPTDQVMIQVAKVTHIYVESKYPYLNTKEALDLAMDSIRIAQEIYLEEKKDASGNVLH